MITKVLVSALIAAGVGVAVAAPAIADPYQCAPSPLATPFCGLSQSAPPKAPADPNQITQGIHQGLSDLHATQRQH